MESPTHSPFALSLMDNCPAPIAAQRDGRFLYVNAAFSELLGHASPEALVGAPVADAIHPQDRPEVLERFSKVQKESVRLPFQAARLLHRDGSVIPVEASARQVELSGEPATLIALNDVTEHKKVESALRESEERLRILTENLREATWLTDWSSKRILYISPAYEHIWGRTCESLYAQPRSWSDAIHPQDRDRAVSMFLEQAEDGRYELEYRILRPDGEERWIYDRAFPVRDDSGQVVLMAGVSDDITDRKNTEQALLQVQKLESLGLLAGGIAHDFNNLLVGMLGFADLADRHTPSSSPASLYISRVSSAARSATDLCSQLLAYAGKGRFVVEPVDLSSIARDTTELISGSIPGNVRLSLDLDSELPSIEADATQMRQIVMNLVTNASESMLGGEGSIRVRSGSLEVDESYLRSCYANNGVLSGPFVFVEVSDSGCGMNEETKARLFDPFFSTKLKGRGLGLAALLGIVRAHRGTLRVDTEPGRGTTLRVLIPASSRPVQAPQPVSAGGHWSGDGMVLVIDDEETVRLFALSALEEAGVRALTAEDGRRGLELFRKHRSEIAVVLLDCIMAEPTSYQVLDEVRRLSAGMPVVLTSGNPEKEATAGFAGKGVVGFVQKPYLADDLINSLRKAAGSLLP